MPTEYPFDDCHIGVVGLGTMGRNFALNLADHNCPVACFDPDPETVRTLESENVQNDLIQTTDSLEALCRMVRPPRAFLLLVPAGKAVDQVIDSLEPLLAGDDLIIDSGNSHFADTDRRLRRLEEKKIHFLGMGMSGGEYGARHGPSLMPGGSKAACDRIMPALMAAAARTSSGPCVAYLGPGSAGHYVKMVHNGIEYGVMQLIAESYDLMKRGLGLEASELHEVYDRWNQGVLNGFLMEITSKIFLQTDPRTGLPLIDLIDDEADQKGTGQWSVADALELRVSTPNIDAAVGMRHMSHRKRAADRESTCMSEPKTGFSGDKPRFIERLEKALYTATIITYAQGFALLEKASRQYAYGLDLETVARIWTGGCIIRAGLLTDIQEAFKRNPNLENLMFSPLLNKTVVSRMDDLRLVIRNGATLGIPIPGMMMALTWWDVYCNHEDWLPANLIMAQRDYFGSHTYRRTDSDGSFHTQWPR